MNYLKIQTIVLFFSLFSLFSQSTSQIENGKALLQSSGLSKSQIEGIAKSKGYSDKDIKSVIQKENSSKTISLEPIPTLNKTVELLEIENNNNLIKSPTKLDKLKVYSGESDLEIIHESGKSNGSIAGSENEKKIFFGYDIFSRDPALFQATTSGAVDPSYLVGPGDEIIVMLWGETQFRQVLKVDREGFVFIPEIGQLFVNGLNLTLLESKLFKVFSQSYASLNPQGKEPTTFLDVSLGNLRPLRIQVLGEVAQPGAYTVSHSATLFSALYYFNGPMFSGSLRDIQLIRGGRKIKSIDFYNYLLTGQKPEDQKLQLDDVIFIPRRKKSVKIQGEINRSGIFELKSGENLLDLLDIAGGLKITAYLGRAQIDRIVPFDERKESKIDRMFYDVNLKDVLGSKKIVPLQDGDRIKILSVLESRQNVVSISGSITRPGSYELGDSLRVSDLISKADGLLGDAYFERVDLVRTNKDFKEKLIKLDLTLALKNNPKHNVLLKDKDRVRIYGMTEMVAKTYVSIIGHVKTPGFYPLQENTTLYDLVFKAGGFVDDEFKKKAYLERAELVRRKENSVEKEIISFSLSEILKKRGMANEKLLANDAIRIFSLVEIEGGKDFIKIIGHVKRPGRYELFKENMTIYDLLFKAGGFDDPIFKSKTYLDRADLIRFDKNRITKTIIPFDLKSVLSDQKNKQNKLLLTGDIIRVYSEEVFTSVKPVFIDGALKNPGEYTYKTKMNLKDLILEAGGLSGNTNEYRVEISRIDPNNNDLSEYATVSLFQLSKNFSMKTLSNTNYNGNQKMAPNAFILEPFDLISIKPTPYFRSQKQVEILGEVLYPGKYTILNSNEKITDIIKRAGGLRANAFLRGSEYFRNNQKINVSFKTITKNNKSSLNFKVQNNDKILINIHPNLINITGGVNKPGIHAFVPGKKMKYYLNLAGGLNQKADKKSMWVEYANGESKKYKRFYISGPKIYDGSKIFIDELEPSEPLDRTEFAKEITSIIANLVQVITITVLALK